MSTANLDSFLAQALQFTPAELELNRAGAVSLGQIDRFKQQLAAQQRSLIIILAAIGVICGLAFARQLIARGVAALRMPDPIAIVIFVIYLGAMLFLVLRGHRVRGEQRIVVVEGPARIDYVKMRGRNAALLEVAGSPRGKLTIGRKTFYVDEATLRAFKPGASYRVYYIKHMVAHTIISAEAIADASCNSRVGG